MLFDNQRTAIGQFQNIFRYPYSGAIKASGLDLKIHPVRASLGKGAEHDHHLTRHPYSGLELEDVANHDKEIRGIGSTLFGSRAAGNT